MKNWTKKLLIGLGTFGLIAGLTACGHQTPEEKQARFVKKLVHKLDLNEAQVPHAENLAKAFSELRQEMKTVRQEQLPKLQTLVDGETVTAEQINAIISAPKQVFEKHQQDIVTQLVALHSVLNSEQKQEISEKLQHIQEHFDDD